jgi:hypothetical protein
VITSDRRVAAWGALRANWIYLKVGARWGLGLEAAGLLVVRHETRSTRPCSPAVWPRVDAREPSARSPNSGAELSTLAH